MRPLARHFGVSGVIATRAEVGDDGRYTGELEFYAYGKQKAEAIQQIAARVGIDLSRSYAYSDSITDLPDARGRSANPVAVNPDKDLRQDRRGARLADPRLPPAGAPAYPAGRRRADPEATVPAAAVAAVAVAAVLVWVVFRSRGGDQGIDA